MLLLTIYLLAFGSLLAQEAAIDEAVIPRKTDLFVVLERALNSQTSAVGDRFHARTAVPVTVNDRIVIPVGSYILGQVDYTRKPGYFKGKGEITLTFDTVILPSGVTRRIEAVAQSAEGHVSGQGNREGKITTSSTQTDDTISGASAGAAIGGSVGAIAGDSLKGFGIGAAVGAATGAILGVIRKGKHVTLPRGASLTIQLEDDIRFVKPELARPVRLKPE